MGFSPNGGNISGADDVALNNPANNQALTYDATLSKWKNSAITTGAHSHTVSDLTDFAAEIRKTDANIFHNGTVYPLRNSVTNDALRRVRWIGPTAPTIGSGYAINGLDIWEQTT